MALTVISRPSKTIEGVESTWNALNLPIQYKFNSDLFPVNSVDSVISISSFANNGGFLEVTLSGASANTLEGETIVLSGVDVDSYNGVWKIKEVVSTTVFVLFVAYDSNITTGDFQKYYNNYFAEVKVYGGLPTYHVDYASKPIQEIGVLRVIPNTSNDIIASFSGIIKGDVNVVKQLSGGIDLNHFTAFYVEYREGYDENVDDTIVTNYTTWTNDEIGNCGNESITNGDFATDLTGWTQQDYTGVGTPFTWSVGTASAGLFTSLLTQVIYQEVNMVANAAYDLEVDITRSNNDTSDFQVLGSNDLITWDVLVNSFGSSSTSISETVVPGSDYQYIGFVFIRQAGGALNTVTIDNISFTSTVCDYLFWGSNSSLQFQNARGGNMYDYINGRADSEFMTNFNVPTLFTGNYFDLSMILNPANASDLDVSGSAYMWLVASDINQADSSIVSTWVDRTGNVTVTGDVGKEPTYKTSGINGLPSINYVSDTFFNTNLNVSQGFIVYVVMDYTSSAICQILGKDAGVGTEMFINAFSDDKIILDSGTVGTSSTYASSSKYVIKATVNGASSSVNINELDIFSGDVGGGGLVNTTIGQPTGAFTVDADISEIIIMPIDTDDCDQWRIKTYLGNKYDAYASNAVGYVQNEYDSTGALINTYLEDVNYTDTGVYRIEPTVNNVDATKMDMQLVTGTTCLSSGIKAININSDCSEQEIYLTWLNGLDGWDYWKFTAEKNHNLNIESKETIKRNIFGNWDTTFISGDTQNDVIGVTAYREIDVFSQYLTLEEVQAISAIKYSIKVLAIIDGVQTTVIVDSDNITVFNDGSDETLHTIRFKIQLPDIQSQSQ